MSDDTAKQDAAHHNFSSWSIREPIPSLLLFVLLVAIGLMDFPRLKVLNFPDLDLPTVTVTVSYPGATASQMETEVTRRIEDSIANVGNVRHVTSIDTTGSSVTTVEFVFGKDINEAVNDVTDAVDQVRSELPLDAQEPIVARVKTVGAAVVTYGVSSTRFKDDELSWFIDNDISKAILGVKGVGQVTRVGGIDREITVDVDPRQLQAFGVSMSTISQAVRSVQQDVPSGDGRIGGLDQSIRTIGTLDDIGKLNALYISIGQGRSVRLDRLATITDGPAEPTQAALFNGKPIISFGVYRARGESEIDVLKGVQAALGPLRQKYPDIQITQLNTTVAQIEDSYHASMNVLYEGAALAVLVVFLFLKDWRATLISAFALPLSIIPTFAAMYWLGFSLNVVTLLALSLVVGLLVDDAIVEIENIVRHVRMGKPPREAAMEAAEEIGLAVIATTFTLVAVFLPTAFMSGIPGLIFKQFGWVAALSVIFSLLVARLLTPMMAAYFLKPATHAEKPDGWMMRHYLSLARWCLAHRGLTMLAVVVFIGLSVFMTRFLSSDFLPQQEQGQISVSVSLPPGAHIDRTIQTAQEARGALKGLDGVKDIYVSIGGTTAGSGPLQGSSAGSVRQATLLLMLIPKKERHVTESALQVEIRRVLQTIPGARFTVGAGSGSQIAIVLESDDSTKLEAAAQKLTTEMLGIPGLSNVISTANQLGPEIVIRPDFARAAALGVTSQDIGEALRIATSGDFDQNVGRFNLPSQQLYIRVRLPVESLRSLDTIRALRLPAANGTVALSTIADVSIGSAPAQIDRHDRSRDVTITAELGSLPLGDAVKQVNALPAMKNLLAGVRSRPSGDLETMQELFGSFALAMLTAVLCVLCVLVLLFKDFLQPLTILVALPLSAGGAIGLLALTGNGLSLPSLIGLLMLMGIVTKNSILLVEYAIMARQKNGLKNSMEREPALLDACHKRAQPIVMTTLAMVVGMIPIALGLEGDSSFRAPMAIAVIGGLLTSTFLSLIVVPVAYTYVDDFEIFLRRLFHRGKAARV